MGKVIRFPEESPQVDSSQKRGPKRASRRKADSMEDLGQLTIYDALAEQVPVRSLRAKNSYFEDALAFDEKGEEKEAEAYYMLAVDHRQSVADAYCNLGILKSIKGETTLAIDFLTNSLKENPRHFEAHYNLGNAYAEAGNFSLAKVHYELATAIDPTDPNSHYNLALVLISMDHYREAINEINRFIELSPTAEHKGAHELISTLNAIAQ